MPIDVSGIIARRARLNTDTNSHPNLPGKPFPGTARGDIPPIIDTTEGTNAQTDLTRRSVINRATRPVPIELRGTVAGRRTPVALLLGKFRTPGKPLYWKHQPNIGWIWTLGFGEKINQPTKVNVNGKDYTPTSQGDGRWHADIDGGDLYVYDGTQDYVDTNLQYISSVNYTDTHEGHCYGVLVLSNPTDWPSVTLVGEGMPDVWDPRLNSGAGDRAYTTNPALLTAYLIETYTPLAIDWTTVETAADYCDQTINGIKRSEIGLALHRRERVEDWVAVLREYAYCYVINNGASVRFITDEARDPVETLGNNEIDIGSTNWVRGDLNTTPENVVVEWTDSDTGVRDEEYAIDGAYDLEDFYNMKGFLDPQQAQLWATRRYNKMTLRDLSGTLEVEGVGIKLDFGDVVTVSDSRFSAIQSKDFEILEISSRDPGKYRCKVIEYQPNTYTDAPQSQPQTPDTTLPDPFDYPDAPTFTVTYGTTNEGVTGDVQHWADVSWETPTEYPYITGWHILAGWGGRPSPSIEPEVLVDIIMPPETTAFRVYGADPLWGAGFSPNDYNFYLTALTTLRPNRVLQFSDLNENLGSGTGADASNGVYHEFLELQDDPTPGPVNNVQVATVTGGVLVTWRYGRRPNYIMQFHVDIVNQTDGDTQTTILSDGLSVFVPDSVFAGDSGDTMRADVKVANRNITIYSSTVSSGTFTAP